MKRLLIACLPWTVIASVGAQIEGPRPAEVHFTHYGRISTPAWQVGQECFVPVEAAQRWGWRATAQKFDVKILADDRTIIVPLRNQAGRATFNLGLAARKLGAGGDWRPGTGAFAVFGFVRKIAIRDGVISVDSTLPCRPRVSLLESPNRIALDFDGMKLDLRGEPEIAPEARYSQFDPTTVRLVVETEKRPVAEPSRMRPSRAFEWNYSTAPDMPPPPEGGATPPPPPSTEVGNGKGNVTDNGNGQTQELPAAPATIVYADTPKTLSQTENRVAIGFPMSEATSPAPMLKRIDASKLELTLPGAVYRGDLEIKLDNELITGIQTLQGPASTVFTIDLRRPLGVELSVNKSTAILALIVPKIGDGKLSSKTIVVDAGHGGYDSGARAPDGSATEKWMTLAIAKELSKALLAEGATVVMTRNDDTFIPLKERPAIGNRINADFFISVHINSNSPNRAATGGMAFYHGHDPISQLLADCIQTEIGKVSKLKSLGALSDFKLYDTGLAVLRLSFGPAALIEFGFINNPNDRARMLSKEFQTQVAAAIVKGLKVYLGNAD